MKARKKKSFDKRFSICTLSILLIWHSVIHETAGVGASFRCDICHSRLARARAWFASEEIFLFQVFSIMFVCFNILFRLQWKKGSLIHRSFVMQLIVERMSAFRGLTFVISRAKYFCPKRIHRSPTYFSDQKTETPCQMKQRQSK